MERKKWKIGENAFAVQSDREIVMTRVFDAPRERVFAAYADPKSIPYWWGPRRYTTIVDKMDVRPGGAWRYISRGADGSEFAFHGVYKEIVPQERIVSTFEFEGMPGRVVVDTATFEKHARGTKVTVTSRFESVEDFKGMFDSGMAEGASETWDRLAELLGGEKPGSPKGDATDRGLTIVRVFDAPRKAVWRAWTDPELVKKWWGPKTFTTPYCTIDLRVGGKYLNCMRSPDGKDYWSTGVYREIVPFEKLVATDSFADAKGNVVPATHYGMSAEIPLEMLIIVTFEDLGGKTKLTLRHVGLPPGGDFHGAQQGWSESFDKLEAFVRGA